MITVGYPIIKKVNPWLTTRMYLDLYWNDEEAADYMVELAVKECYTKYRVPRPEDVDQE
jgi:hypothetical protein